MKLWCSNRLEEENRLLEEQEKKAQEESRVMQLKMEQEEESKLNEELLFCDEDISPGDDKSRRLSAQLKELKRVCRVKLIHAR